jgi:hypothetical protein
MAPDLILMLRLLQVKVTLRLSAVSQSIRRGLEPLVRLLVKLKVKVKLSLCLTKHHAMKAYWWSGGIAPRILLTFALDGGEWSASRSGRFTHRKRAPDTHWIGGWVGPRAVLDAVVKRECPSPRRESNPRTPIVQRVGQCYTDWAITALLWDSWPYFNT